MKNITVPELGESIIEGTLTSWLIKEGDSFKSGDNLAEIETEKITIEIPAQTSGTLTKIITPVGATVNVGQSIAEISDQITPEEITETKINQTPDTKEFKEGPLDEDIAECVAKNDLTVASVLKRLKLDRKSVV